MATTKDFTKEEIDRSERLNTYIGVGAAIVQLNQFLHQNKDVELRWCNGVISIFFKGKDMASSMGTRGVPFWESEFSTIAGFASSVIQGK